MGSDFNGSQGGKKHLLSYNTTQYKALPRTIVLRVSLSQIHRICP